MKLLFAVILLTIGVRGYTSVTKRDTIHLYNGQVLIGEIQTVQGGILTIDDADLKDIQVKLYKIKSIQSPQQYRVVSVNRTEYYGAIQASGTNGHINIVAINGVVVTSIGIEEINLLLPLETSFFKRLSGNISSGFSYTKSSDIGQLNINANLSYATRLFENELTVSEIGSLDSSKFSRDNEIAEIFSIYNITPSWFGAGSLNYQRNLELSIARRFQEIIGGGNKLLVKKNLQLLIVSGLAFTQEKSVSGESSGLLLEIPLSLRFNLYQFSHPNIQITTSQTTYISLSEKGRVRYSGNTNFYIEIMRDFYINIGPYSNYDSQPPTTDNNKFDFGITVGISYKL